MLVFNFNPRMNLHKILLIILCLLPVSVMAQEIEPVRPVLSAYTVAVGSAHIAETYLSPLKYSGQHFSLDYERMQAMKFRPDKWIMQLHGNLDLNHTSNPARNATMWDFRFAVGWGMARRWNTSPQWSFYVGGHTDLDAGAFYSRRNSNNPVAAKASWTIGAWSGAAWNGRIGQLPLCVRYQTSLPLLGAFFSPQYGELYYEIYLGNHSNLVRCAWPGNFVRWHNTLTADLRLGSASLRVGYGFNMESSEASHIVTRRITHSAILGVTSEWISLSPKRRNSADARIIQALYR